MKRMNNEAVSPVVGVMLMLVVTIIIAAVVSAFAGGLGGDQHKTPQASITAVPVIQSFSDTDDTDFGSDYETGFTAANGIEFENVGGDTFSLSDINIQLECGGTKYTLTPADKIPYSTGTCLPANITANDMYFAKVGSTSPYDMTIAPGDKFMLYADNHYDSTNSIYGPSAYNGKYLVWHPVGPDGGIGAQFGTKVDYMVIDRASSRTISTGEVVFR